MTRSVLALEIYRIVRGVDIAFAIRTILKIIIDNLKLLAILIIICTESDLLYKYLVKLGTIKKKRLIINIIAIWQLYKRRELIEI